MLVDAPLLVKLLYGAAVIGVGLGVVAWILWLALESWRS